MGAFPQPAAAPQVPLSVSLWVPYAELPSRRSPPCRGSGLRGRGRAAPQAGQLRGRPAGVAEPRPPHGVSVCAGGKAAPRSSPAASSCPLSPSRSLRARGMHSSTSAPVGYTPLALARSLPKAGGDSGPGFRLSLLVPFSECDFHPLSASIFLPFPSNGFSCVSIHLFLWPLSRESWSNTTR